MMRLNLSKFFIIAACVTALNWNEKASAQTQGEWQPKQPVEFVIMGGSGGGADKAARTLIDIIEKKQLASVAFKPVNMPENSGGDGLRYLKSKKADDHTIMFTLNSFYTTPLKQPELGINIEEMTPIARMAEDTFLLWISADKNDIQSLEDFIAAAKQNAQSWTMGGTGTDSEDNLLTDYLNAQFQMKMAYKSFNGGGEVAEQLAAKTIDSTVNNPSEQQALYGEGKTKPIVSFTTERLASFPDTPTLKELGYDFEYLMQRSVVGSPEMSQEAQAYYSNIFQKVFESPEWQEYRKVNSLQGDFLTGTALMEYWVKQRNIHRVMLQVMELMRN